MSKIKVVVIGAGAAGLCSAKHMSCEPDVFEFTVYEQGSNVGGTWCFTKNVGYNEYGLPIHSSMYENLVTNLPKEVMAFPDFPFKNYGRKSFLHHTQVLKYLEEYADKYDLLKNIKFHHNVKNVKPVTLSSSDPKWIVEVENITNGEKIINTCDSVMVCNGQYSVPYVPEIEGFESFNGLLMHSHNYRNNAIFENMKVVVLGAGPSGLDIAIEILEAAKEVVLSHDLKVRTFPFPEKIIQEPGIITIQEKSITFRNQKVYVCDALLLCTGYSFSYPFFHEDCDVKVDNHRVQPLFKHLFHAKYPTLGIWGIMKPVVPFPLYDQQCLTFLKYLKKEICLPSTADMLIDIENDFESRLKLGMKFKHAHVMASNLLWEYDEQLSVLGKIPRFSKALRDLFVYVRITRENDILHYREKNYKIINNEKFVEL